MKYQFDFYLILILLYNFFVLELSPYFKGDVFSMSDS